MATHFDSEVCIDIQRESGCHACQQEQCLSSSELCSAALRCSTAVHVCKRNAETGCNSCQWSCHNDCSGTLCPLEPCAFCLTYDVTTHVGSAACIAQQRTNGCHASSRSDVGTQSSVAVLHYRRCRSRTHCHRFHCEMVTRTSAT